MKIRILTGDPHTDQLLAAALLLWDGPLTHAAGEDGNVLVISDASADTLPQSFLEEADVILAGWHSDSWLTAPLHRQLSEEKIYAALPLPVFLPEWEKAILNLKGTTAVQPSVPALQLIPEENLIRCGTRSARLTDREFRLLAILQEHRGQIVSKETLIAAVWPGGVEGNACEVHMTHLRRKLIPLLGEGALGSIRGKGYLLR